VFRAQYRLAELKALVAEIFTAIDVLVLPTIGTTFTVEDVLAAPITTNTTLGHYTHFANLLDLCAAVVPAGTTSDGRPASCMLLGPALSDDVVLAVAEALQSPLREGEHR
jgi:allophanate hydrolase